MIHFRSLRHTRCLAAQARVHAAVVQEHLGHQAITIKVETLLKRDAVDGQRAAGQLFATLYDSLS
jgi:hypothetical protein